MTTAEPAGDEADESPGGDIDPAPGDADGGDTSPEPVAGGAVTSPTAAGEADVDPAPGDPDDSHAPPDPTPGGNGGVDSAPGDADDSHAPPDPTAAGDADVDPVPGDADGSDGSPDPTTGEGADVDSAPGDADGGDTSPDPVAGGAMTSPTAGGGADVDSAPGDADGSDGSPNPVAGGDGDVDSAPGDADTSHAPADPVAGGDGDVDPASGDADGSHAAPELVVGGTLTSPTTGGDGDPAPGDADGVDTSPEPTAGGGADVDSAPGDADGGDGSPESVAGGAVTSPDPGGGADVDAAPGDADGGDASPEPVAGGAVTSATAGGGGDVDSVPGDADGSHAAPDPDPGGGADVDPAPGDADGGAAANAEDLPQATGAASTSADRLADRVGSDESAGAPPESPSGEGAVVARPPEPAADDDDAGAGPGAGTPGQDQPGASSPVVSELPGEAAPAAPPGAPSWAGILRAARRLGDRPRHVILASAVPVLAVVLVVLSWAIDSATLSGQVMRNVEVADRPVGGLSEASLPDVIDRIAEDVASRQVRIVEGDRVYETTAGDIGVTLDRDATAAAALDVGRRDSVLPRPFSWLGSFFDPRQVPVRYAVSEGAVALKLAELQGDDALAPVEPTIVYDGNTQQLAARPGRNGVGIDARQVATALADVAERDASGPIEITAERTEVAHRFADEEAAELAAQANEMTADGLTLAVEQTSVRLEAHQLRGWIGQAPPSDGLDLAIDGAAVARDLLTVVGALPGAPRNATVTLAAGGNPQVRPASRGVTCCADDSAERIWDALQAGESTARLAAREADAEITTEEARQWRIARPVGGNRAWRDGAEVPGPAPGFTTYHQPGEPRVVNIHRIADLVRGAVIPPGGTFSVNERVGERTTDNGFVEAGAISNGQHVSEVGGGVSQFATTTFNAAYFAGLDIVESQAHSEYFDRYPRGREATMGYPNPDLVIENNTPYGVLIWTSYTDTSLTVTMYSTPYARAEQTAIAESGSGQCTNVETTRTRTYPDGRRETDTFRATYRPGAGLDCDGSPLPPAPNG